MSNIDKYLNEPFYKIRLSGNLDQKWSGWFNGMTVTYNENSQITTLSGKIPDQAKLRGVLNKLWDLNLEIISLIRFEDNL
jgi:hypothetical protein